MIPHTFLRFFYLLLLYITNACAQSTSKSLGWDIPTSGKLEENDSFDFFYLTIPESMSTEDSNLIISIKQSDKSEQFSDPDIYVSKVQEKPTALTATWKCERYGEDIISINSSYFHPKDIFYISVYCQFKCSYTLKAYLSGKETLIEPAKVYSYDLPKDSSANFVFKTQSTHYKELSFSFISPDAMPFKVYISKDINPSSNNSFEMEPSWFSGYTYNLLQNSQEYCINCSYHIIIQSTSQDVTVQFSVAYTETELALNIFEPFLDHVAKRSSHCYSYPMSRYTSTETIVITVMLFSGTSVLQFNGFSRVWDMDYSHIRYDETTYEITSEKVILLTPSELNNYQQGVSDVSNIHFCIFGHEKSSYLLRVNFDFEMETLQRFNIIFAGSKLTSYLRQNLVTSYRILDFSRDSDLSISLDSIEGNSVLYGYFNEDEENYVYYNQTILEDHWNNDRNNTLILPEETFAGYEIKVINSNNKCHKKLPSEPSTDWKEELRKLGCSLYAIVHCMGGTGNDCIYRLRVSHNETIQQLIPRTSFYSMWSMNQKNVYKIQIEDEHVIELIVALNAISGDTSLKVYQFIPATNTSKVLDYSRNEGYIPNVIQVTREDIKQNNWIGQYRIEVQAQSFATYSIYYYTVSNSPNPGTQDISLELETGHVIYDYILNNTNYKIYSYELDTKGNTKQDVRITLTRRNGEFKFYVYLNLNSVKYIAENRIDCLEGYLWKSDFNNELIISKSDENYSATGPYFIVVTRSFFFGNNDENSQHSYYIGVTDETSPFLLFENVQHSAVWTGKYPNQSYWYTHVHVKEDFSLSWNVAYGKVDIYIDFKAFDMENPPDENSKVYFKKMFTGTDYVVLPSQVLSDKCSQEINCPIYVLIAKSTGFTSGVKYLITGKSRTNSIQFIQQGVTWTNNINVNEIQYFVIEDFDPDKHTERRIHMTLWTGNADAYIALTTNDTISTEHFPNDVDYLYKAEDSYYGSKLLSLLPKDLTACSSKCKYLIAVYGTSLGFTNNTITYSINYETEIREFIPNIPYKAFIKEGNIQYFKIYLIETTENIHLSVYTPDGDVNLYMNNGVQWPTFSKFHWSALDTKKQFIHIDKNDPVITSLGKHGLEDVYSIMIYGYKDSSYSWYWTTNKINVMPIGNNVPGNCICHNKGDKCLYKFDNWWWQDSEYLGDTETTSVRVMFFTEVTYGSGNMYAKLFPHNNYQDLAEQDFPGKGNYEFSNIQSNKMNFMNVEIPKTHQSLNVGSMIILSIECNEKSLLDINAAQLSESSYQYLDLTRENVYYLKKSAKPTVFSYYIYQNYYLNMEVYSYSGSGNVLIYQNTTRWDNENRKSVVEYNEIADFNLSSKKFFYRTLPKSSKVLYQNIYFKVIPSTDFGFYIKINYDQDWTSIGLGKTHTFLVNNGKFFGYFEVLPEYREVVLSVMPELKSSFASVYVKLNTYRKDGVDESNINKELNTWSIPDESNYDYFSTSNDILSSINIKINQIPEEQRKENEHVRALVLVYMPNIFSSSSQDAKSFDVLVSPSVNYYKRIESRPLQFYFSTETALYKDKTIFEITKSNKTDNVVVIEWSSCKGEVDVVIRDSISYFNDDKEKVRYVVTNTNGRKVVFIPSATFETYYLEVFGVKEPILNCTPDEVKDVGNERCKKDVQYLMYYYTSSQMNYSRSLIDATFLFKFNRNGNLEILLPELKQRDYAGQTRDITKMQFRVYVSSNIMDFAQMESLCYLSNMEGVRENVKYKYEKEANAIEVTGLENKKSYFVNVQITNLDNGEIFIFKPKQIVVDVGVGLPAGLIVFIAGAVIGVILLFYYFYRKYRIAKSTLRYQINDARESVSDPGSLNDIGHVNVGDRQMDTKNSKSFYTTLNEENSGEI